MSNQPTSEDTIELPDVIALLPLRNQVLFPGSIIPIDVGRPSSVKLVEEAIAAERPIIGIVAQRDAQVENPGREDIFDVGCGARILKVIKLAKDSYSVILQGVVRMHIHDLTSTEPFLEARVSEVGDITVSSTECDALVANIKETAKKLVSLLPELPREVASSMIWWRWRGDRGEIAGRLQRDCREMAQGRLSDGLVRYPP